MDDGKGGHSARHRSITDGTEGSIVPNGVLGWDGEDFSTEPSCELIPGVGCDGEVGVAVCGVVFGEGLEYAVRWDVWMWLLGCDAAGGGGGWV